MEDVRQLMGIIDEHVKLFPEGAYLKMCTNLKNIFKILKNPQGEESESESDIDLTYEDEGDDTDGEWSAGDNVYAVVHNRVVETDPLDHPLITGQRVPFQPVLPGQELDVFDNATLQFEERVPSGRSILDLELQRTRIHQEYLILDDHLKHAKRRFKNLKYRCNITTWVRCEAVKQFCECRMLHVPEYTLQAVTDSYPQYTFSDERAFFGEYLLRYNDDVREQMYNLSNQIDILTVRYDDCIQRYHECQ